MPLKPGATLLNGQYEILSLIGEGGFGYVYHAQDTLLGQSVAIKELVPAPGHEAFLKRFLAEARATLALTHVRIVRTYTIFQDAGAGPEARHYIVMEYMPGGSLEEKLQDRGALPLDEALTIAAQVCEGLQHAHEAGVVHCDLKPANVLFDAQGGAKVADFGIAHVSDQMLTRTWQTAAGFTAGTLPYMSPEQTAGCRDDPRVDVYALGAILYRMLTGHPCLELDHSDTPKAQAGNVHRILSQEPLPPSTFVHSIPRWLDNIVLRSLAKQTEYRYTSAAELTAALLEARQRPASPDAQTPWEVLPATMPNLTSSSDKTRPRAPEVQITCPGQES